MAIMTTENGEYVNNNKNCPCCNSDMKRNSSDSPHDLYTEHYTCTNNQCAASVTINKEL